MSDHEPLRPLSTSQREALEEAVARYQASVSADAARYLLGRGIDRATADAFRLGVVADPLPEHGRFRGMLAIPYLDHIGRPLSLRFRCLQDHSCRDYGHGKYMSCKEEPARVFNIKSVHQASDTIEVTEGEFDTMILTKLGLHSIAIPGAHLWRGHHRRMLAGFNLVRVWADPDDAGAELAHKITRALRSAKGVRLTTGDVSDTYRTGGAEALLSLIEQEDHTR